MCHQERLLVPIEAWEHPQAVRSALLLGSEELPVKEAILDGEVVALDSEGRQNFRDLLAGHGNLHYADAAERLDLEGIVAKRKADPYRPVRRSGTRSRAGRTHRGRGGGSCSSGTDSRPSWRDTVVALLKGA